MRIGGHTFRYYYFIDTNDIWRKLLATRKKKLFVVKCSKKNVCVCVFIDVNDRTKLPKIQIFQQLTKIGC